MWHHFRAKSAAWSYAFAGLAVAGAVGARLALDPVLGTYSPYLPFVAAITIVARLGGRGPALAATALSIQTVWYFFIDPQHSFDVGRPATAGLLLFAAIGVFVSLFVGDLRQSLISIANAKAALMQNARLINLSHDAIITADANRIITGWNDGAAELYGWTEAEALGKPIHGLLQTSSSVERVEIDRILARDGRWQGELTHIGRDGRQIVTESRQVLVRDCDGAPAALMEINRDITERKRAEENLRHSESLFRAVIENVAEGIYLKDRSGHTLLSNPAATKAGAEGEQDERVMAQGKTAVCEKIVGTGDQKRVYLSTKSPWRDRDGKVIGMVAVSTDITERKRAEEALRVNESCVRRELESILSPDEDIGDLELNDIVDASAIQSLMDDLYGLAAIPMALLDANGKILVGTGWQEICTRFHRIHPDSCKHCVESDTGLTSGILPGTFRLYRCKNNLWDCATPLVVGGRHLGNLFTGQFLLEDQPVNRSLFEAQCREYGFDADAYMAALDAVPRVNRENVQKCITFLAKLGEMIGKLSYANIKLAKSLNQLKASQAAVEQVMEQRGLALEAARLGAWDYRVDTGEVFSDERCRDMFDFHGTQVRYQDAIARIHPEDRTATIKAVADAVAGANAGNYHREFRVVWSDGSIHWIGSHGRVYDRRLIGVNMDITGAKRAQLDLAEANRRREILAEVVGQLLASERPQSIVSDLARKVMAHLDCQVFLNYLADPEDGCLCLNACAGISEDTAARIEWLDSPDGQTDFATLLRLNSYAWQSMSAGGKTIGTLSFGSVRRSTFSPEDISFMQAVADHMAIAIERVRSQTALLESEEQLRRLNLELELRVLDRTAQLEASNKELEAFAYSVSHDLRAPLRGIDGWSLALLEDYGSQLDQTALRYLDRVRAETQRMGHLIDDLLQLSRITRTEMHRDAVDLSAIAESIAGRLRENHPDRCLEFRIQPDLTAFGDARLLEIAVSNLLDNAVKFTRPRPCARIEFSLLEWGGEPAFVIRDNGVGFDMAYASTLFGAFQRLHSESEFHGTGIGLATVQRIIHRHGGRIWAEAEPDCGAAFYFTIGMEK